MNIEIGRYAGFCQGVKHAVNGAFAGARETDGEVLTDGELIHNPQTLELLKQHDVRVLGPGESLDQVRGRVVIVRAHGVPPERLEELHQVAAEVRNLTCRDVAKVQGVIRKYSRRGYGVVIFGKKDHPEVRGLMGYAEDGYTVMSRQEVEGLPELERVLVVSQTTMNQHAFAGICEAVAGRFEHVEIVNTICDATELRQNEVREMARRHDCILVIGGASSSNTRRLHEIASQHSRAMLVSDVIEVRKLPFGDVKSLGVTAGASTPDWLIHEVVEEVRRVTRRPLLRSARSLLLFTLYCKIFVAVGAYVLSYAVADNLGVPFSTDVAVLVSLYYLSMSLLNSYTARASLRIEDSRRYRFMHRWRHLFFAVFAAAYIGLLTIALRLGQDVLVLVLFSLVLGIGYNLSYLPLASSSRRILLVPQRDLLAIKSFVISFAVTILLNGLPLLRHYPDIPSDLASAAEVFKGLGFYFSLYYVFMLMFTRQALSEMRSAQTDRIAGVSSLLNIMHQRYVTLLLYALPTVLVAIMAVGLAAGVYPADKAKYFVAVGYNYLVLILSGQRKVVASHLTFELLLESNLYVAGLVALA